MTAATTAAAAEPTADPAAGPGGAGQRKRRPRAVDDAAAKALAFVLRSTAMRPQTEEEVRGRLHSREVPDDALELTVTRAKAMGAVDDAAFAAAWVDDRGRKRGYGIRRLREELERRLVPAEMIEGALARMAGFDAEAAATDLAAERAQRLPPSLKPDAVARRLHGFLVRRGYQPGLAQRVAVEVSGLRATWD